MMFAASVAGGMAQGGGSDGPEPSQQGRDAEFTDQRDTRQSPHVAAAHSSSEGV